MIEPSDFFCNQIRVSLTMQTKRTLLAVAAELKALTEARLAQIGTTIRDLLRQQTVFGIIAAECSGGSLSGRPILHALADDVPGFPTPSGEINHDRYTCPLHRPC
jgi:hypothetical protein